MYKIIFKFAFFFLSFLFAAAFVGILTKHDFLPYITEHAQELSTHRTREELNFHFVDRIEKFPHGDERLPKRYSGVVKIKILCKNATRFVILHSRDLDILNVSLATAEKTREKGLVVERILTFKENQQLCIELKQTLREGNVHFVTLESDRLEGFYKTYYVTHREFLMKRLYVCLFTAVKSKGKPNSKSQNSFL